MDATRTETPSETIEPAADAATAEPTEAGTPPRRSDAGSWARPMGRLRTDGTSAPLDTVRGRRPVGAIQGFGKLWQKTYRVSLEGVTASPEEVVREWRKHFSEMWPKDATFYAPFTGIEPGEVALLDATVLPGFKLSTGVVVIYVDAESFTFMTPEGHMFAGWITFSASRGADGITVAQAQVLMRGQGPLSELGLTIYGHGQEDRFWQKTLLRLAQHFGANYSPVDTQVVCVDPRRQWRRAGNIRHDASFKSALFMATAPVRWVRRAVARR